MCCKLLYGTRKRISSRTLLGGNLVNKGKKEGRDIYTPVLRHAPSMLGIRSGYSPRTDA